jgi:hypothetical protein
MRDMIETRRRIPIRHQAHRLDPPARRQRLFGLLGHLMTGDATRARKLIERFQAAAFARAGQRAFAAGIDQHRLAGATAVALAAAIGGAGQQELADKVFFDRPHCGRHIGVRQLLLGLRFIERQRMTAAALAFHGDRFEMFRIAAEAVAIGATEQGLGARHLHLFRVQMQGMREAQIGALARRWRPLAAQTPPRPSPPGGIETPKRERELRMTGQRQTRHRRGQFGGPRGLGNGAQIAMAIDTERTVVAQQIARLVVLLVATRASHGVEQRRIHQAPIKVRVDGFVAVPTAAIRCRLEQFHMAGLAIAADLGA